MVIFCIRTSLLCIWLPIPWDIGLRVWITTIWNDDELGIIKALFLEHEGYCGAVGALLCRIDKYIDQYLDHIVDEYQEYEFDLMFTFSCGIDRSILKRKASMDYNINYCMDHERVDYL